MIFVYDNYTAKQLNKWFMRSSKTIADHTYCATKVLDLALKGDPIPAQLREEYQQTLKAMGWAINFGNIVQSWNFPRQPNLLFIVVANPQKNIGGFASEFKFCACERLIGESPYEGGIDEQLYDLERDRKNIDAGIDDAQAIDMGTLTNEGGLGNPDWVLNSCVFPDSLLAELTRSINRNLDGKAKKED